MQLILRIQDKTWTPGLKLARDFDMELLLSDFMKFMGDTYRDLLKLAIDNQRFRWKWKPLSEDWLEEKALKGWNMGMWTATDFLRDNIYSYRRGEKIFVGLAPNKKHPHSKLTTLELARVLEYGTRDGHVPARPLFRPLHTHLRKNVRRYWLKFLVSKGFEEYIVSEPIL